MTLAWFIESLKSKGALLIGSGPSATPDAIRDARGDRAAVSVSSAIKLIDDPDAWFSLHGLEWYPDHADMLRKSGTILKVWPKWTRTIGGSLKREHEKEGANATVIPMNGRPVQDGVREPFDGHLPLLNLGPGRRSTLFALQAIVYLGARDINLIGVDLEFGQDGSEYAWGRLEGNWRNGETLRDVAARGLGLELKGWKRIGSAARRRGVQIHALGGGQLSGMFQ